MKNFKLFIFIMLTHNLLFAHGLWINTFESYSKKGGHVIVGLGTGHHLSIDDAISSRVNLVTFTLQDPNNNKIKLRKPKNKIDEIYSKNNTEIFDANLAMQKISFSNKSIGGTYSIGFVTKKSYLTKYIDEKGRNKFKRVPKQEIKNAKEIISSTSYTTYAKSYFAFKRFSKIKELGHKLEIIPLSDISKLYIGDTIYLKVLYKGKPLTKGFLTATNNLSKNENSLYSPIRKGKAKFVLTNFGQWSFNIVHKELGEITDINKASATINIK